MRVLGIGTPTRAQIKQKYLRLLPKIQQLHLKKLDIAVKNEIIADAWDLQKDISLFLMKNALEPNDSMFEILAKCGEIINKEAA